MKIEQDTIVFKSTNEFFQKEKDGRKPNTVRFLDKNELFFALKLWNCGTLKRIRIVLDDAERSDSFERELTDVTWAGGLLGKNLVIFSWADNELRQWLDERIKEADEKYRSEVTDWDHWLTRRKAFEEMRRWLDERN